MRDSLTFAIITFLILFPTTILSATVERTSNYDIWWRGFRIGDGKISTRDAGEGKVAFRSEIRVSAGFLAFRHTLHSIEEAVVGPDGTASYRLTATENGKERVSEGSFKNGVFQMSVICDGSTTHFSFPRRSFDATTMECPEKTMGPEKKEMTLRLLDLETAQIVTRRYRWVGNEKVAVAGKEFQSGIVDYQDEGKKGRRWIRANEAVTHILRQDGKGKDGSYSLRIKSVKET
jgi:hypothetical protein